MSTDNDIETVEAEAEAVKRILRRQARRPFVVELTGTPKAGKTTLIGQTDSFLRQCGWRVHVMRERAGECPLPMKGHFFFNTWTTGTMLAGLLDAVDREHDLIILDRGLFDALIWLKMQLEDKHVSLDEGAVFGGFVKLQRWRQLVDSVVLVRVEPDVAMRRENAGRLRPRVGSVMNELRLGKFNDVMDVLREEEQQCFDLTMLSNEGEAKEAAMGLIRHILAKARAWADPKIAVLPRILVEEVIPRKVIPWDEGWEKLVRQVRWELRSEVEESEELVQLLACGVQTCGDELFLIRRQRLREDVMAPRDQTAMLWRGCHVTRGDGESLSLVELKTQLAERLRGDLHLGSLAANGEPRGFVWVPDGPDSQHLGAIFNVRVDETVKGFLNERSFKTNGRGRSTENLFVRPDQLTPDSVALKGYRLESWSQEFLAQRWFP